MLIQRMKIQLNRAKRGHSISQWFSPWVLDSKLDVLIYLFHHVVLRLPEVSTLFRNKNRDLSTIHLDKKSQMSNKIYKQTNKHIISKLWPEFHSQVFWEISHFIIKSVCDLNVGQRTRMCKNSQKRMTDMFLYRCMACCSSCMVCLLGGPDVVGKKDDDEDGHLVELLQDISTDLLQLLQAVHRVLRLLVNRLQLASNLCNNKNMFRLFCFPTVVSSLVKLVLRTVCFSNMSPICNCFGCIIKA